MLKAEKLAAHIRSGKTVLDFFETVPDNEQVSWRDGRNRADLSGNVYHFTQVRFDDASVATIATGEDGDEMIFLTELDLGKAFGHATTLRTH